MNRTPRPFRFGASAHQPFANDGSSIAAQIKERARRAEAEGYSWIGLPDHLHFPMAPIATMMAMAAATTTLRVSATVLDNNFRHPVILAKEIASIDVLSEGRVELGIGAGSLPFEHPTYLGVPKAPVAVRVRKLEEALKVIKGLWAPAPFAMQGEFYSLLQPLDGLPKPVQTPRPPIRIGGVGQQLLSLAGREADIANILVRRWPGIRAYDDLSPMRWDLIPAPTQADLAERIDWIRAAAGDRFEQIELELHMWACRVTDDPAALAEQLIPRLGPTAQAVLAAPDVAIGSVEFIAEQLQERREKFGVSAFTGVPPAVVARLQGG